MLDETSHILRLVKCASTSGLPLMLWNSSSPAPARPTLAPAQLDELGQGFCFSYSPALKLSFLPRFPPILYQDEY